MSFCCLSTFKEEYILDASKQQQFNDSYVITEPFAPPISTLVFGMWEGEGGSGMEGIEEKSGWGGRYEGIYKGDRGDVERWRWKK